MAIERSALQASLREGVLPQSVQVERVLSPGLVGRLHRKRGPFRGLPGLRGYSRLGSLLTLGIQVRGTEMHPVLMSGVPGVWRGVAPPPCVPFHAPLRYGIGADSRVAEDVLTSAD